MDCPLQASHFPSAQLSGLLEEGQMIVPTGTALPEGATATTSIGVKLLLFSARQELPSIAKRQSRSPR